MQLPGFGRRLKVSRDSPGAHELRPVHKDKNDKDESGKDKTDEDDSVVHLIAITADGEFYRRLQQLAHTAGWWIRRAGSIGEVQTLTVRRPTPIVIYEPDSTEPDWSGSLSRLSGLPAQPCVLLASQVADYYLQQEVVRNHGYDVLPKTAPAEKVIRCLEFAWFWSRARGKQKDPA